MRSSAVRCCGDGSLVVFFSPQYWRTFRAVLFGGRRYRIVDSIRCRLVTEHGFSRDQAAMNANASVSFSVEELVEYNPVVYSVTPAIDGTPLTQLITAFESGQQFEPAGGYGGLVPQFFDYGPLDRYLVGECAPGSYWANLDGIYVLGCDCGEVGCWPLLCRVTVDAETVVWDGFKQPYRPERDYSQFGPFVFNAAQYRTAANELQVRFSERVSTESEKGL